MKGEMDEKLCIFDENKETKRDKPRL